MCILQDLSEDVVKQLLENVKVTGYKPTSKKIETDETASKPEDDMSGDQLLDAATQLQGVIDRGQVDTGNTIKDSIYKVKSQDLQKCQRWNLRLKFPRAYLFQVKY